MKDLIYKLMPDFVQNLMVSGFNYFAYKSRYGGKYKFFRTIFKRNRDLSLTELEEIQAEKFSQFLKYSIEKSDYYRDYPLVTLKNISNLPIIKKEVVRENISKFYTVLKDDGIVSKTGGTTGKSLEVVFTPSDLQERFAFLDDFRSRFGYELGKRTAWFSGKNLLSSSDINNNIFWKTDYFNKVRYYSTFHIKKSYLKYYVENLIKFKPEYLVGFPSTIVEIAKYGLENAYDFPPNTIKAVFPTAETISPEMRKNIELFFKTKLYNQYASSEGAPFIVECINGNLHLELQSGVFEVLDNEDRPTQEGRLVITSFTTHGTPLIRYDIGDSLVLDGGNKCDCGNNNPLVKEILGRVDDYIYSPENGKINLGNISNTLKDVKGIVKFQVVQNKLNEIELLVVKDDKEFTPKYKDQFLKNWIDRVGHNMIINIKYMDEIAVEKSGKFRMVKNNIKSQIDSY